jgi:hypothetical protein
MENKDIIEDEIEVTCEANPLSIEMDLQQLNINHNLVCGIYIYADKETGTAQVSKIGMPNLIEVLEKAYLDWTLQNIEGCND